MTKQELIEKLKTRIELAEGDIAMATNDFDSDMAIIKKVFMKQTLELVEQLDEPPNFEEVITHLETKRRTALDHFNIAYANVLQKKVEELKTIIEDFRQ